jgi:hypothetical protein
MTSECEKFPEFEYVRGLCNNDANVLHEILYFKAPEIATRQGSEQGLDVLLYEEEKSVT